MTPAYYNEHDKYAAQWLRNLIVAGHIAPGDVDERSIVDVRPDDLRAYRQCHFFAGIGVWSYSLRRAGWPDDREVWTASCPCQPFSVAGKGAGLADERHLWPAFFSLARERRPRRVFGEQVASKDGLAWLDLVHADMESAGYAFGAVDLCAAGIGAPHIRQRLYFVGALDHAERIRRDSRGANYASDDRNIVDAAGSHAARSVADAERDGGRANEPGRRPEERAADGRGGTTVCVADAAPRGFGIDGSASRNAGHAAQRDAACGMADNDEDGRSGFAPPRLHGRRDGAGSDEPTQGNADGPRGNDADGRGESGVMGDTEGAVGRRELDARGTGSGRRGPTGTSEPRLLVNPEHARLERHGWDGDIGYESRRLDADTARSIAATGATRGHWADADWLLCRDGKARPVEPGTFPLAYGAPARVGRLRAFGNAIVAALAVEFIEASDDVLNINP